jgi:hypothetical protein
MSNLNVSNVRSGEPAGTSFEEKSVWIQLAALGCVMVGYFVTAGQMLAVGVTNLVPYAPVFAGSVVLLVMILIVAHIVAALAKRPEERDERDRQISWRAESAAGWVVPAGVVFGITRRGM